eukprot:361612-Chlamydomonas_euryale.AAC.27
MRRFVALYGGRVRRGGVCLSGRSEFAVAVDPAAPGLSQWWQWRLPRQRQWGQAAGGQSPGPRGCWPDDLQSSYNVLCGESGASALMQVLSAFCTRLLDWQTMRFVTRLFAQTLPEPGAVSAVQGVLRQTAPRQGCRRPDAFPVVS